MTEAGGSGDGVSAARTHDLRLDVVEGRRAVMDTIADLDRLARDVGAPVTARGAWLTARIGSSPQARPWAVLLRGADGELQAAAALLDIPDGDAWTTVLAAGGDGHRAVLPARDPGAGELLARTLAEAVVSRSSDPRVALGPLPLDEVTQRLVAALPGAATIEATRPIPYVRRGESALATGYLSHGLRRTLRKAANRMAADGVPAEITFLTDPAAILELAPVMAAAHQQRDHDHGLASSFDTDEGTRGWHVRLRHLTEAREIELAVLRLDGALAAYVVGLPDPPAYRILEGRFVTEWARYSPGRVLESTVLQRFLDDDRFAVLDWMTGVAPGSLLTVTDVEPRVSIRLGSAPARRGSQAAASAASAAGARVG